MPPLNEALCRRFVSEARVAVVATADPNGRPNLVPFVFVIEGDTLYSAVDRKPKTTPRLRRVDNIRARPDQVTVLVQHFDEDWTRVWWVRMRGRGRILEDGPEADRALALLSEKYEQYGEEPPAEPVIAIDVTEWRGWSYRPIE